MVGKTLRLQRIFTRGRALIAGPDLLAEDPVQKIRLLVRTGVDAAILTPGALEMVAEELGTLAPILQAGGGPSYTRLLGAEAALIMGADAVLVDMAAGPAVFAGIADEARRLGLPLVANVSCPDWFEDARLAADFGADVLLIQHASGGPEYRQFARQTGKPCLPAIPDAPDAATLLRLVADAMQAGAQGLVLGHASLLEPAVFKAIHALVHQGVSAEEALSMLPPGAA